MHPFTKIQQFLRRTGGLAALLLLGAGLTACVARENESGYVRAMADFSQITPGQSTAEDVIRLLGSPSSRASYGKPTWYYISTKSEQTAFYKPEITDQGVVEIIFTPEGVVEAVNTKGIGDRRDLAFEKNTTPTEGNSMNIIQQLLGNLGRFNPGGGRGYDRGREGGPPI